MTDISLITLITTAAVLGLLHTILGPDHYVPFIALSRARKWSIRRTAAITTICGLAHVGSSVIIGLFGLKLGYRLSQLEAFEAIRGDFTAWLIISFGLLYSIYGIKKAVSSGKVMEKLEKNNKYEKDKKPYKQLTPWVLFVVFLFGPCEPLIPLLMFPAANISIMSIVLVAGVFGLITISTMLVMVLLPIYGIQRVKIPAFNAINKYGHVIAGVLILCCGIGIRFMGL